jgi:CHAD domain-containing protein
MTIDHDDDPVRSSATVTSLSDDDLAHEPTAGEALHRVLARSARTFLLNDVGIVPTTDRTGSADPEGGGWVPIATLAGAPRRATETERIHQSRVACRRIRSNLRTFRLLVDPVWSISLRAELAWYAGCLGESRDLHVLHESLAGVGTDGTDGTDGDDTAIRAVLEVIGRSISDSEARVDHAREGDRYARLVEQMLLLWDGPILTPKAGQAASEVLPSLLERSWHDVRGAARTARKHPTDDNLHKLRIRIKGLRYGCETAATVEGGPARKTARAAERLQSRLGDLHDAGVAIAWLQALGERKPDLAPAVERLVEAEQASAQASRKGWKDDLKEVERRWRRWQG